MQTSPTSEIRTELGGSPNKLVAYLDDFHSFREHLFNLYRDQSARLEPKHSIYGMGTAWGYWLAEWEGRKSITKCTAASIGTDEIRLLYDICHLTRPSLSYVVGHSFGLSTFCLALAWSQGRVVAIDNWSEPDTQLLAKPLTERILAGGCFSHVHVHSGSSPQDTPAALAEANVGPVSLFFIDGWHRNPAALADFNGALPYLDKRSVVLWHNVNEVYEAFQAAYESQGGGPHLFDEIHVLRTQGPMGIFYAKSENPTLHSYLADGSYIWSQFEFHREIFDNHMYVRRMLGLRDTWTAKLAGLVSRLVRGFHKIVRMR